jgi:phosphosulfolactate synthase (CoM biosynthesis protein A)
MFKLLQVDKRTTYDFLKVNEQYLHRITWSTGTCSIMAMSLLLYELDLMVTEIYVYVWPLIQWLVL